MATNPLDQADTDHPLTVTQIACYCAEVAQLDAMVARRRVPAESRNRSVAIIRIKHGLQADDLTV